MKNLLFIPMYNCEKQITRVLAQLTNEVCKFISEVIIINNRSTDNGEKAVIDFLNEHEMAVKVSLLRNDENYGLGGSHKVAFMYAVDKGFDYVIVLHGDDQGRIADFVPVLRSKKYSGYDCVLGARFMKGSKLFGYSKLRIWGNYGFNLLFSLALRKKIYDLGSGLNMYKVSTLESRYYFKYPDTLYFNDLMIIASRHRRQKMLFYPISWREEDQVSNNKLISFSVALCRMLAMYLIYRDKYMKSEMRNKKIKNYSAQTIFSNIKGA